MYYFFTKCNFSQTIDNKTRFNYICVKTVLKKYKKWQNNLKT